MMDLPAHLERYRAAWQQATDAPALERYAGASVYGRGQAYARDGAVSGLVTSFEDETLCARAMVAGTHDYAVQWRIGSDGASSVSCDCPHAQDANFCKHQVAVGLILHADLAGEALAVDAQAGQKRAAAARRGQTQAAHRRDLLDFLGQQNAAALAERLWHWAEQDRALMADLQAWASLARLSAGTIAASELKPAITQLLGHRGFLDYHAARSYAQRASAVTELLRQASDSSPAAARSLCEHALKRLWKVLTHADDSDGLIGDITLDVLAVLKEAVAAAPPPAAWLKNWFALLEADPFGLWADDVLVDVAGPEFQRAWGQRVTDEWLAWAADNNRQQAGASHDPVSWDWQRVRLRQRYINHLKRQGDTPAVLQALQTWQQNAREASELVQYCESMGQYRQALQFAEEACRRFDDDWRLQDDLLRCYERDGWDEEALAIWRQKLQRQPTPENYHQVLRAARVAGRDPQACRAELLAWAAECERRQQQQARRWQAQAPLDVSLRLSWLLHDDHLADALALVQPPHVARPDLLEKLAQRLPPAQRAEALALLQRVFDLHMQTAKSPYRQALALVRRILSCQTPGEQRAWLAQLRTQYKPKRNFIKELPDA